jgi:hypothetical protein
MAQDNMKMKIVIDGDNKGFKKSLNQTSRDIKQFEQQTGKVKGGGGMGSTLINAGALNMLTGGKAWEGIKGHLGDRISNNSAFAYGLLNKKNTVDRFRVRTEARKNSPYAEVRDRAAANIRDNATHGTTHESLRNRMNQGSALRGKLGQGLAGVNTMMGGVATAAAAAAVTILIANGAKWAKRINEASSQYSGVAMGNRARIEAENTRRDIRLARTYGGSTVMRDNAANFRRNSGTEVGGGIANILGTGYDAAVGAANNVLGFNMTGGPLGWVYRQMTSEGGPK